MGCALLFGGNVLAQDLRDPTRPGWTPPASNSDTGTSKAAAPAVLTAIVIGSQKRLALIGEHYVGVGDRVAGATLIRIAFDHVVLRDGNSERVLRLTPLLDSRSAAKVTSP